MLTCLVASSAFAGDVKFNVNFGNWRVRDTGRSRVVVPQYPVVVPYYYYWVPPPEPPPPQVIYIEREPAPPPEPPPPPPPQVIVVQVAAPAPPPAPEPVPVPVPAPAPVVAVPLPPREPGPDVFQWTDEDGVVNYSTRVPADARKKAKKIAAPTK